MCVCVCVLESVCVRERASCLCMHVRNPSLRYYASFGSQVSRACCLPRGQVWVMRLLLLRWRAGAACVRQLHYCIPCCCCCCISSPTLTWTCRARPCYRLPATEPQRGRKRAALVRADLDVLRHASLCARFLANRQRRVVELGHYALLVAHVHDAAVPQRTRTNER